jgi:hypothetical protein
VKGISDVLLRTEGTVLLNLFTSTHETTHLFHVMGENFGCLYDGILGQDFWKDKGATIDYCNRVIVMGEVMLHFDDRPDETTDSTWLLTLNSRTENIVHLPTKFTGLGIVTKKELAPGVYLAETLTEGIDGYCITSIVNTSQVDVTIRPPVIELEEAQIDGDSSTLFFSASVSENCGRLSKLNDALRTDHLDSEERTSLVKICEEYNVFWLSGDKLTFTTAAEHNIPTPAIDPMRGVNTKPYRIPEVHREEVRRQTDQMLLDGIIEPSTSPWNSPILVIPKKEDASGRKKWRIVVDFRKLNEVTVGDSFPLPVITEILDALGNSKYFSTIDCASGFLQVPVRPKGQAKTAFSTREGHFHYKRMPYGLKGDPATFQRLMTAVLSGIQGIKCLVYLDNVVIFRQTLEAHNDRLREVFSRMRKHNLQLQPDKCEFLPKEVSYLGHVIGPTGVRPDEKRVKVVRDFPQPKTTRELEGFFGTCRLL